MSVTRLQVKEMYRLHKEVSSKVLDGGREVVTREELERRFPFIEEMSDFDELEFRYGLIRYRIRKF